MKDKKFGNFRVYGKTGCMDFYSGWMHLEDEDIENFKKAIKERERRFKKFKEELKKKSEVEQ